jgi:PKD repeat protein
MYEFHGLGSLLVGQDGSLIISCGDGTSNHGADIGGDSLYSFASQALQYGIITPDQDIGSYKAQYLGSYNGKILRIDPETGDGLPSNPFFDPENPRSPQSRTWALGLRNPYRIHIRPETGSHYMVDGKPGIIYAGDVGNGKWEEINVITEGGMNFGWPIYEGNLLMWGFFIKEVPDNQMTRNPLYGDSCKQEFFNFRDLLKAPRKDEELIFPNPCDPQQYIPAEVLPMEARFAAISWSNALWNKPSRAVIPVFNDSGDISNLVIEDSLSTVKGVSFDGYSSLSGVFYTADQFPEKYHNKFFSVDFSGWIRVFEFDENQQLLSVEPFHNDSPDIIHLALNPVDGALYYINIAGEVRKISYGGNPAPVAIINADKLFGPGPLSVQFDGSQSYDVNSDDLTYSWDFGNGQVHEGVEASFTFSSDGQTIKSYPVSLTVTDPEGASTTQTIMVSVNNSPPEVDIISFEDGDHYPLDKTVLLVLDAEVKDAEHSKEELLYEWKVYLHHNDHFHPEPTDFNPQTHMLVSPLGCDDEIYYYRIELTVSDPEGLSSTDSRIIQPYCATDFVGFTDLSLRAGEKSIKLSWNTTIEKEVLHYEVQRSPDFYHFEKIGIVDSQLSTSDYWYEDKTPLMGRNNYRIKAIKKVERAFDYSNLASITFPRVLHVKIYPNPARAQLTVEIKESQSDQIGFEIFNSHGQKILATYWEATTGEKLQRELILPRWPQGIYFYRLLNGDVPKTGRLVLGY